MGRTYTKKLIEGEIFQDAEDENPTENKTDAPATLKDVLNSFKQAVYFKLKWSLNEIDNTDFFNLLSFFNSMLKSETEGKVSSKVINGQEYKLSDKGPAWL